MDFLKDFLGKIAERTPLTFLIVGALFLIIGVLGGYPPIGLLVPTEWRIVSAIVGLILVIVAMYLASRETSAPIDCDKYEISITSPQENETVSPPVILTGRCKALPKGYELWVFSISTGGLVRYWPQSPSEIKNETWKVTAHPGNWKPNDRRRYGVFLVGEHGRKLVLYYKTVGNELSGKGVSTPGIPDLNSDIIQCGPTREVILK
jgi:hypothetical protein